MPNLLRYSSFLLLMLAWVVAPAQSQSWKPAMNGMAAQQRIDSYPGGFRIYFKSNGPLGKDWIYGHWLDEDSLYRNVAYREGGRWVPLPFSDNNTGYTGDIVQYGDTLYISGSFRDVVIKGNPDTIPVTTLLKYYNDSIWSASYALADTWAMEVSGDTLLTWTLVYVDSDTIIQGPHLMTTNGGSSWQYPYSIVHPTESKPNFGVWTTFKIRDGSIYTLNDNSTGTFDGVVRWDGQQWHGFGNGIYGIFSKAYDFEFYRDELYMSGSFNKAEDPRNPGNFVVKWNGSFWESVGGGANSGAFDLTVYKDVLYCQIVLDGFGDATIPHFAGWNGQQWCGTPITYTGDFPRTIGFINDTLFMAVRTLPATANGDTLSYINYFDGDYLNGPNAICSTPGLEEEENEITSENTITLHPNPARSEVYLQLDGRNKETENIKVYDSSGKLILHKQINASQAIGKYTKLDVTSLPNGIYVITINGVHHAKLVKI